MIHFGKVDESDLTKTIDLSDENANKAFVLVQKCLRALINKQNWEQTVDLCQEIIESSIQILKRKNFIYV